MKTPLLSTLREAFRLAQRSNAHPDIPVDELITAPKPSRRDFLQLTARAGLVVGLGGAGTGFDILRQTLGKPREKIAIVGAGMAGLSAAYHLRQKGVAATVFEADKRVGGRIKSARVFDNGRLNTEIGAEFIDTGHADMLGFVRLLGLENQIMDVETDTFGQRDAMFIHGRHYGLQELVTELRQTIPKVEADRKHYKRRLDALDNRSMADYIDGMPVSDWVKTLLHAAYLGENGLETAEQSAAILVSILALEGDNFMPFGDSDERYKIRGGNDQIPKGLAARLEDQLRFEHRLLGVRENANGSIQLRFDHGGTTVEETFDVVVVTLPFTVLREIDLQLDMPDLKKRCIRELGYGTNTKFILETAERPWRKNGYRGYLFNERIPNGWDSSQLQQDNSGAGTFTAYFGGNRGRTAARGTEQAQLDFILPALDGAFPGTKTNLTGKHELAHWPGNPFAKASYSCFSVGQITRFEGVAAQPVRNLHFAGEHTSADYWGFMNGAAESGRLAAKKLLKKMHIRS